jgi:anti-sigma regulatory factor (Ser/Thr protein kinase)
LGPMTSDASADSPVIDRHLTLDSLTAIRSVVEGAARDAGLNGERAIGFALAIDEAMTNAIRYAGGGTVSITAVPGAYVAIDVRDQGPGIPDGVTADLPGPGAVRGRGLWLMRSLCDRFDIDTGPDGTSVRLFAFVASPDGPIRPVR